MELSSVSCDSAGSTTSTNSCALELKMPEEIASYLCRQLCDNRQQQARNSIVVHRVAMSLHAIADEDTADPELSRRLRELAYELLQLQRPVQRS